MTTVSLTINGTGLAASMDPEVIFPRYMIKEKDGRLKGGGEVSQQLSLPSHQALKDKTE